MISSPMSLSSLSARASIALTTFLIASSTLAQDGGGGAAPAAPGAQPGGGGLFGSPMLMIVLMMVLFWVMIIRPQSKQRKALETLQKNLKTGDRVITTAGIHAIVANVKEKSVTLKVADNVKIQFDRSAIASVTPKDQGGDSKDEGDKPAEDSSTS